jgi:ankyrin repeat protein
VAFFYLSVCFYVCFVWRCLGFQGHTPLHIACAMGKLEAIRTLQHLGASIDAVCNTGSNGAHVAARNKELQGLEVFKEIGGNIQLVNEDGFTSLGVAIEFNQPAVVKKLVDLGADPNIPNADGFTAVHMCAYYDRTDLFALLVESHDCDLLAEDKVSGVPTVSIDLDPYTY